MVDDRMTDPGGSTYPRISLDNVVAVPRLSVEILREGGKPSERRAQLEGEHVRIGSHPGNDLVLDDRLVSRFHWRD